MTKNNDNDEEKEMDFHMEKITDENINHNYMFRICLIGTQSVGKTSLLLTFTDNSFKEKYSPTVGVDFRVVTLKYKDIITKIHIWDTAGQERFKSIATNYYRSSNGFIYVYDISDRESFNNLEGWINLTNENTRSNVINFLVGNKNDLESKREVSIEEGEDFAKRHNLIFLESSAKTNNNVQRLFEYFTYKLIKYFENNKSKYIGEGEDDLCSFVEFKPIDLGKEDDFDRKKCSC